MLGFRFSPPPSSPSSGFPFELLVLFFEYVYVWNRYMYVRESGSSTVLLVDTEVLVVEDVIWDAATTVLLLL